MTRSYSSNGVTISSSNSGSGANICSKCDITLPPNFEAEYTWKGGAKYSGEVAIGGMRFTHSHYGGNYTWYYYQECNNRDNSTQVELVHALNSGDVFKVTRENHVLKIYLNGTLKHTVTRSSDYNYLELGAFHSQRYTIIKDIKIKSL